MTMTLHLKQGTQCYANHVMADLLIRIGEGDFWRVCDKQGAGCCSNRQAATNTVDKLKTTGDIFEFIAQTISGSVVVSIHEQSTWVESKDEVTIMNVCACAFNEMLQWENEVELTVRVARLHCELLLKNT